MQLKANPCRGGRVSVSLVACCPLVKNSTPTARPKARPRAWRRLRPVPHGKRPGARDRHRSRCFRCGWLCGWLGRWCSRRGAPLRGSGLFLGCFFLSRLFSRLFFGCLLHQRSSGRLARVLLRRFARQLLFLGARSLRRLLTAGFLGHADLLLTTAV